MIVRMIVATILGPCVFPLDAGAGSGAPPVGIFPAKAVPERAHARETAITKRFMEFLL
jgi:hypothetical protein